MFLTEVKVLMG